MSAATGAGRSRHTIFSIMPYAVSVSIAAFFVAMVQLDDAYGPGTLILFLLFGAIFYLPLGAAICLAISIVLAWHRCFATAFGVFMGPLVFTATFLLLSRPPLSRILHVMLIALPDKVATYYITPERTREVAEMFRDGNSAPLKIWYLTTHGLSIGGDIRYLVYDPADEVGRPRGDRSVEWKQRVLSLADSERDSGLLRSALADDDGWVADAVQLHSHFWVVELPYPQRSR